MKSLIAITLVAAGALVTGGCATRKYVRETAAPVQAKVDQVGEQTTQNSQQIQSTRADLKQLDEKTANGINAAKEKANAADQHAADADRHAGEADRHANDAMTKATQADSKADANMQALRTAVANIDDYKVQTAAAVPFGFNQYKIAEDARHDVDALIVAAKSDSRYFIVVEGYTDKTGDKDYNEALSKRRADEVVQYLVAKGDIPIFRIHTIGLGDLKPVDEGNTREARAHNRRVEVKLFTADALAVSLGAQVVSADVLKK